MVGNNSVREQTGQKKLRAKLSPGT